MQKILYVEDEEALRDDIAEFLEEEGYEVATAANGQDGLDALRRFSPDLILSDCLMPVMNGIEMMKALRVQLPEFSKTPIVLLSAHAQKSQVEGGLDFGAQHYLAKPVDYDKLAMVIKDLLAVQGGEAAEPRSGPPGREFPKAGAD